MIVKTDRININTQEYYSEYFLSHDPGNNYMYMVTKNKELCDFIKTCDSIIDVGGAAGAFLEELNRMLKPGGVLTVCDFSVGAFNKYKDTERSSYIKYEVCRVEDLKLKANVVFCFQTLEHVDDIWLATKKLWEAVIPGGYLFISLPCFPSCDHCSHIWQIDRNGSFELLEMVTENLVTYYPFGLQGKQFMSVRKLRW